MSNNICGLQTGGISSSFSSSFSHLIGLSICSKASCSTIMGQTTIRGYFGSCFSGQSRNAQIVGSIVSRKRHNKILLSGQIMSMRLMASKKKMLFKVKSNVERITSPRGCAETNDNERDESNAKASHRESVYKDYVVIEIPGDGRCMFRSVAYGSCLRSGKPPPTGNFQKELADDLRAKVADEFVKRKEEIKEWFIEGDFESNISEIRKPHVWGDEPELFIASHVLQMPITVYKNDWKAGGLISIAEYGQEYGKENPIRVLYNGSSHYDALEFPRRKGSKSRLWHFTFQMLKRLKAFI